MASMPKFEILSAFFMLCLSFASAERDFNFNDSQISLLEPKDEPINRYNQDPYAAEVARCHYTESEMVLSLVLKNHDWSNMSEVKKGKVLNKLSKFFAIPKEFIILESVTKRELYEMQKQSIRKGNNKCHSNRRLGRVDLMIGCGPKYFSMGEPIANQIGQQMKDGSIDNITGEKFGWWIIWRKSNKSRAQRSRRQALEGSGEDDYEDDSYDYDEDEEDIVEPVTEIPTTTTHAHRHHHGASKPDLTETSSNELTNKNNNVVVVDAVASNALLENNNNKNNSNHQLVASNIDEEIVKSVSQLESVITKTIENTKHIKELPVLPVDEVEDVDADEAEEEEEPEEVSAVDETAAEVVDKNSDLQQFILTSSTTPEILTTTSSSNGGSSTINVSGKKFTFDSDLERLNGLVAPISVVDINESTAMSALTTVSVALEQTTTTATITATSTPLSTLLTSSHTPPQAPSSQSQSPLSPYDASSSLPSSNSSVVVVSSYPSTSFSSSSSLASSSSSSSIPATTPTMQSKEEGGEESDVTLRPDGNEIPIAHFNFSSTNISIPNIPNTPNITLLTDFFNELSSFLSSSTQPPTTIVTIPTTSSTTTPATTTTTTSLPPETSTQMSSSVSTDYVEPKVENTPPMIKTRLQKFAVASGKAFRYIVPAETFFDNEDLSNLRLELTDKDGHELKPSSWLQFNAETHEIYGLPLDDTVSKYTYRLSATDSGNLSVTETLEMSVQQHRGVRSVNHEINIAVKINEKHMPNIDWQMKLIRAIATTLGDETTNNLVVREIRQTQQDPTAATFIYFNETLPTTECPDAELNNLIQRLDVTRLADLLYPTLGIKSITGQLVGPCQKQHISNKAKLPTNMSKNLPPMPRNQVDRVNATVGHLLVFKVPSDTFYDPNDNELTLTLKTKDNRELSPRHWLQFDTKNQEFYGIPKSGDIGSEEYLLVAEDNGGLTAADALVVVVNHAPKKEFSAYFKAYLAIRHEQFNADLQRKFVERLTQLFGDHTTQFIQIRSITTHHDADATIVNFYNTTLHKTHNRCPEEEIEATRNVYLMQDYMVRDRVKQALGPELNVTNVQVIPLGSCHPQPNVIHHDIIPTKTDEPTLKSTFAENYLFTFIVPAVIIVVLILVASVIACCLHRRRMSGKMELGDEEERKSFRPKGIPVIFQDELDEKPEIGNKSPIILKDEKPPLLPPSYNTSNMNGENDVDEYVPPPAVVVGGREARGKSPATPSYRKPPPYVSP